MNRYKNIIPGLFAIILVVCGLNACNRYKPKTVDKTPVSFKSIANIPFIEVRRRLSNGMSFDNQGFQTEPSYKITFLTNDSASVYSPDKKQFINFLVFLEQDSIFNVARSYFKMLQMNKDSLKLQVLEVEGDTLHMQRSLVYMTFYSADYIKSHHMDLDELKKPDKRDTAFIIKKAEIARRIPDSAFAARQPVTIKSKSAQVIVNTAVNKPDVLNNFDASDNYMNPEFNIIINKAYDNFSYSFLVYVDDKGQMSFDKPIDYIMPEFKDATIKTMKGIMDGYLKFYLQVTPGSTLGIKHTSAVIVNVVGKKG